MRIYPSDRPITHYTLHYTLHYTFHCARHYALHNALHYAHINATTVTSRVDTTNGREAEAPTLRGAALS